MHTYIHTYIYIYIYTYVCMCIHFDMIKHTDLKVRGGGGWRLPSSFTSPPPLSLGTKVILSFL